MGRTMNEGLSNSLKTGTGEMAKVEVKNGSNT